MPTFSRAAKQHDILLHLHVQETSTKDPESDTASEPPPKRRKAGPLRSIPAWPSNRCDSCNSGSKYWDQNAYESWAKGTWKGLPLRKPLGMQLTVSAKVFSEMAKDFFFWPTLPRHSFLQHLLFSGQPGSISGWGKAENRCKGQGICILSYPPLEV